MAHLQGRAAAAAPQASPLLRLAGSGLSAIRGGRTIFAGIDFSVGAGEMLALTGANGAGKSTLLRMIAGLLPPSTGTLTFVPEPDEERGAAIHYLAHADALKPTLSVRDNLRYWARVWDAAGDPDDALDAAGIGGLGVLPAGVLSAGQKRRAAIARMLLTERPVWLLDEPLTALDAAGETLLGALIARQLGRGGIVIAATHRPLPALAAVTLALPDRVAA